MFGTISKPLLRWVWLYMPIIPALWKLRQEDFKFKANLDYIAKAYLKK